MSEPRRPGQNASRTVGQHAWRTVDRASSCERCGLTAIWRFRTVRGRIEALCFYARNGADVSESAARSCPAAAPPPAAAKPVKLSGTKRAAAPRARAAKKKRKVSARGRG